MKNYVLKYPVKKTHQKHKQAGTEATWQSIEGKDINQH